LKYRELLEKLDAARVYLTEVAGTVKEDPALLDQLNEARTELRASYGKTLDAVVGEDNEFAKELLEWIALVPVPATIEDLAACVPQEAEDVRPPLPSGSRTIERADGEGRMVVFPREEPFVVKAPVLEEADEDTVGKD